MALLPLFERHRERLCDRRAHHLGIVWIDQERSAELGRRACKTRQDQDAGVVLVLGSDILLGHEVHAVAQRRHQRGPRGAVEAGQHAAAVGAVDVADRRPGGLAISAVDAAGGRADRALHLGIFLDLGAALRGDLQISHLAAPIGVDRKEALERIHALSEAFRIIEPVDADHHGAAGEAVEHVLHERGTHRASSQPAELAGLDPDREYADAHRVAVRLVGELAALLQPAFTLEIAGEIGRVILGLQTDEIVGAQLRDQPFVVRQCGDDLGRWERNVQKEPDPVAVTAIAKHLGEWHEMIVMHPHEVVRLEDIVELRGEMRVDPPIPAQIAARELGEIEPVVQNGPEHAIGEAAVVLLIVGFSEIGHDVGDVTARDRLGDGILLARDAATPAEPDAGPALEQGTHRDRQTARLADAVLARNRHAVGNDDQPRQ